MWQFGDQVGEMRWRWFGRELRRGGAARQEVTREHGEGARFVANASPDHIGGGGWAGATLYMFTFS